MISRETLNVIHMGCGFLVVYGAFDSQAFIEETVIDTLADEKKVDKHAGYYSLAINYASFTLGNLVSAPLVEAIGPRMAMIASSLCFTMFHIGFFFLNSPYLYFSSVVVGFASAVLWTAQGKYLSQNSNEASSDRHSAIFVGLATASYGVAGAVLLIVFSTEDSNTIDRMTVKKLYSVFSVVSLIANLTFLFLRRPSKTTVATETLDYKKLLGSTFRLMFTKQMLLLALAFAYTGLELSFASGILTTVISFTRRLNADSNTMMGWNGVAQGIGWVIGSAFCNLRATYSTMIGRKSIILIGTVANLICYLLVFLFFPSDSPINETDESSLLATRQEYVNWKKEIRYFG